MFDLEITNEKCEYENKGMSVASAAQGIKEARERGFDIIYTKPKTLLLDLDSPEALQEYEAQILFLIKALPFGLKETRRWASKSGNTHVELELTTRLGTMEKLLFTVLLGSDRKRAVFSVGKYYEGVSEEALSVLYQPNGAGLVL